MRKQEKKRKDEVKEKERKGRTRNRSERPGLKANNAVVAKIGNINLPIRSQGETPGTIKADIQAKAVDKVAVLIKDLAVMALQIRQDNIAVLVNSHSSWAEKVLIIGTKAPENLGNRLAGILPIQDLDAAVIAISDNQAVISVGMRRAEDTGRILKLACFFSAGSKGAVQVSVGVEEEDAVVLIVGHSQLAVRAEAAAKRSFHLLATSKLSLQLSVSPENLDLALSGSNDVDLLVPDCDSTGIGFHSVLRAADLHDLLHPLVVHADTMPIGFSDINVSL